MSDWPYCAIADHNQQKINGFCSNPICKSKSRLLCFICLQQTIHDDHKNDIIVFEKLPEWLSSQQETSQNFLNTLHSILDKIQQPILKITKNIENQLQLSSVQDLKNLGYSNLNDTFRNQVHSRILISNIQKSKTEQMVEQFSQILQKLGDLITEQSITNSIFQKRLNSLFNPNINTKEKNSINRDQSLRNLFQTDNNLQGLKSAKSIQEGLLETQLTPLEFLSQLYNQMVSTQPHFKAEPTVNDGIEYLIIGEREKAQGIFDILSQQKPDQETVIWSAYFKCLQKKYQEAISILKQFGNSQEKKQNPQFWYILALSVIGLQNYNDAVQCIQKYLKLRPYSFKGWIKAGLILLKIGEYTLAIQYLQQVLKFEPNNIEAKYYLYIAYFKNGQTQLAERQYIELQQIEQKNNFLNCNQPNFKN